MAVVGYALAALVGLSLGLLGGGGSILTVPIFVYVMGIDPKLAIAMSLPVIGVTSLVGAVSHWRSGNVQPKTALLFGSLTMVGAYVGARLSPLLTGAMQMALLAVVMMTAAISMLRSARSQANAGSPSPTVSDGGSVRLSLLVPIALAVGVLTGLVGIGGGFLVVPALVVLARTPMRQAIGTSLPVIAMNSAAGFVGYLGQVPMPWRVMLLFTAIAVAGILAGSALVRFVSQAALKQAFAVLLIVMGTFVLYRNRSVFGEIGAASRAPSHVSPVSHAGTPPHRSVPLT